MSKKSWHTKNLANQEKVWMAEQRSEAEAQKTKELAKQIQQEREQEELEKISGKKGPKLDRGIDWMYQGTTGELAKEDAERKAEEFLLGKEYIPEGATHGDFDNGDQDQGINSILKKQQEEAVKPTINGNALDLEPSVKDRNEDFRLRVEDPMFFVSQKQREKVIQHDKTKALYERVVGYEEDDHRVNTKITKETTMKERKRHKKHKKSKARKRDRDHDDDSSDSYSSEDDNLKHRHRRRRSRDRDSSRRKRHQRSSSNDRDRSHRSHDDRDLRKDRGDRRYPEDNRSSRKRRHESDSDYDGKDSKANSRRHDNRHRSEDDDRDYDRRRRRHDDIRDHQDYHRHSHQSHDKHDRRPYSKSPSPDRHDKKMEGYGLKGASLTVDPNDLGPSRDLLQKKREEREMERRKIREAASTRRPRTEAERAKALEEMQANARKREESRLSGPKKIYEDDEDNDARASKGEAGFIKDVTRQTYGIVGEGGQSLSSRVAQNRHTNQRMSDSFL